MNGKQRIAFRCLFFFYVAVLLFLCFGKFDGAPKVSPVLLGIPTDKLVHFCLFFPFPVLAFLAFDQFTNTWRSSLFFTLATLATGCLLALGTEWGQAHLTDYRSGDPNDFLADLIALTLSSILVFIWDIRKQRK